VKIDAKTSGVVHYRTLILAMCCNGCAVAFTPAAEVSVSEPTPDSGPEAAPLARAESGVDSGAEAKAGLGDAMVAMADAGNAEASAPDSSGVASDASDAAATCVAQPPEKALCSGYATLICPVGVLPVGWVGCVGPMSVPGNQSEWAWCCQ
jgi:hypothetical protein